MSDYCLYIQRATAVPEWSIDSIIYHGINYCIILVIRGAHLIKNVVQKAFVKTAALNWFLQDRFSQRPIQNVGPLKYCPCLCAMCTETVWRQQHNTTHGRMVMKACHCVAQFYSIIRHQGIQIIFGAKDTCTGGRLCKTSMKRQWNVTQTTFGRMHINARSVASFTFKVGLGKGSLK